MVLPSSRSAPVFSAGLNEMPRDKCSRTGGGGHSTLGKQNPLSVADKNLTNL